MALFYECKEQCTYIVLDIAGIVRDRDVSLRKTVSVVSVRRSAGALAWTTVQETCLAVEFSMSADA
jgi:hypothetical protein